jgi:hypothetical protein
MAFDFGLSALVIAVISAGASYIQAKKAQKKAKEATEGVEANIESNSKEIPVIYGERRVGGTRVYIDTSRDVKHQYLYMVLVMAEGKVESISDIKIDDIPITDSRFTGKITTSVHLGDDNQPVSTLIKNGTKYDNDEDVWDDPYDDEHDPDDLIPSVSYPWGDNHRLRGVAYLALKFKWDENAYSGVPNVTAVVKGKKVYNPDTGVTEWSDNPALCIRDYLTNSRYGKGLPASAIDDTAFISAMNDLNGFTITPFTGSTDTQKLFTMNHVVDTSKTILQNLNDMLLSCRAFLPYSNGLYSLKIDQTSSSVMSIGADKIISGIAIAGTKKEDRFNQVKVNFFNKAQNYKEDQAVYPESDTGLYQTYLTEDEDEPLIDEVDCFSINNYYSAREMARLFLERSRQNMTVAFQGTSELINLEVGEVVSITHPTPQWTNKLFQVQEVALGFDGTVQVTCIEYDAALYTYDTPDEEQPFIGSRLPDPNQVDPVTLLTTTTGTYIESDGKAIGYIDITWSAPSDSLVDRYEIKFQYSSKEEVIEVASAEYRYKPTQDNVSYTISVRAVNGLGIRSSWVDASAITSVVDTTAPSVPTGITATGGIKHITLDWTNPTEDDFDVVEIYAHTSDIADLTTVQTTASLIATVKVDNFQHDLNANEVTRHYFLRSVDRTGNKSAFTDGVSQSTVKVVSGDMDVNELSDISADLGAITGGSININSGVFTVDSSGNMNSTSAVIDGNITAQSLDVEDATVTGTFIAPIGWSDSTYTHVIGRGNLSESVTNLIDERIAEYGLSSSGDFKEATGSFYWEDDDPTDTLQRTYPTISSFSHANGRPVEITITGSRTWSEYLATAPADPVTTENDITLTLQTKLSSSSTWTDLQTWTRDGSPEITGGNYSNSYGNVYYIGVNIAIEYTHTGHTADDYDYRVVIGDNLGTNYTHQVDINLQANEAGTATGGGVNDYADSFTVNTSGVLTIGRTGSLADLTADISTYVSNQVSALVDSAPDALNTLNELASALGDDENFSVTVNNSIATKASKAGDTFTGTVNINKTGTALNIRSAEDTTTPSKITFSTQGTSGTQIGHIQYTHRDGSSYGANESFTIGGTESSTVILADGQFYYKDGIYKKPASGTEAGTRKDANWDTAYGWGNHASAGYLTSVPSEYLTQTEGDARYALPSSVVQTVYQKNMNTSSAGYISFEFTGYVGTIGRDFYVFDVIGYKDFTDAESFVHYTVYLNCKGAFGGTLAENTITADVISRNQSVDANLTFKLERNLSPNNTHKLWIGIDEGYSGIHILHYPTYIGDLTRVSSTSFDFTSTEPTTTATFEPTAYLPLTGGTVTGVTSFVGTDVGGGTSSYADFIIKDVDAHLDITSNSAGSWGSVINLRETDGTDFVNSWSIARNTGSSANLNFNFGTVNDHNVGGIKVSISSTGVISALEGNSNEWNDAFNWGDHGSAGYLTSIPTPIAGDWWNNGFAQIRTDGVMEVGKYIDFHGTDTGTSDFSARVTNNGSHLYASGRWYVNNNQRVFADDYHPNADKWTTARTITLSGDLTGSVSIDGSSNATLSAQVVNDSHTHDGRYVNVTGDTMTGDLILGTNQLNFKTSGDSTSPQLLGHRSSTDLNSRFFTSEGGFSYTTFDGGTSNRPSTVTNNANGLFTFNTHSGSYSHQLSFTNGGGVFHRDNHNGTISSWDRIFADDYHPNADKWTTARTLSLTGDVTGSVSWDGSANASITTVVANDSHTHDGRYYTETESDSRFANITGDTFTGNVNVDGGYLQAHGLFYLRDDLNFINSGANGWHTIIEKNGGNPYFNAIDSYRVGGTTVIDSSRNLTNIGTITTSGKGIFGGDDNYIRVGGSGGGKSGVFGNRMTSNGSNLSYGAYLAYDAFWNGSAWQANRTTLTRKWMTHIGGYHDNNFHINYYGNSASGTWADSDWTRLLTLNSSGLLNTLSGYQVNGTTVIDSSLNLINIDDATIGTGSANFTRYTSANLSVPDLKFYAGGKTGWGVDDELGKIRWYINDGSGIGARDAVKIVALCESGNGTSTTTFSGALAFHTSSYNAQPRETIRFDSNGNLNVKIGDYQVNGTTVIDSNRNLTNVSSIFASSRISTSSTVSASSLSGITTGQGAFFAYHPTHTAGTTTYYPTIGSTSIHNNGYRQHLSFGHKRASAWDEAYIALGGNDAYPTKEWLFDAVSGSFSSESYKVSGTTVIDSSRSLTNIGLITCSGSLTSSDKVKSVYSSTNYSQLESNASGGVLKLEGGGSTLLRSYGLSEFPNGIGIGSTTVIDSSRNLINVGKINSGAITNDNTGALRILHPDGASYTSNGATGAIKITLPVAWTNTMMRMTVKVYEYTTGESFEVCVGGYNHTGSNGLWYNTFAHIISDPDTNRNFTVRYGHDGSKACIWIGETNSSWAYPKVSVVDFQAGHNSSSEATWATGWSVGFVTSFGTVQRSHTNNEVGIDGYEKRIGGITVIDSSRNATFANLTTSGTTTLGNGTGDKTKINDILELWSTDSGDAHFYFGENSSGGYGSYWNWDSSYTHTWHSRHAGTNSAIMSHDTRYTHKFRVNRGIERVGHSNGYFIGSYNSTGANSYKTNPIYTIGDSYRPTDTSLGNMYGVGYAHNNFWGSGKSVGWGLYVCEAGVFKTTIAAGGLWQNGTIDATGGFKLNSTVVIDGSRNLTNIGNATLSGDINCDDVITNRVIDKADSSTYLELRGDGGGLRAQTASGHIDIGARNTSHAHFYTDRSNYYFNTEIRVDSGIIGSYNEDLKLRRASNSSHQMTLTTSGATFTGNVTAYSDARLKDNVKTLDGSKVYEMRGVSFTKDGELGSGVIAQELEQVAPELVMTNSDEMQTKSVAYGNVVGYLIEAIKELKLEIEELKNGTNSN